MLMDRYEPLFFNANFREADGAYVAYRGELVLKEGEVADALGRKKPPVEVMKQAIVLTEGDQLRLLSGSIDELQYFPSLLDKFGDVLQSGARVVLFVVNIDAPFVVRANAASVVCIPLVQGMTWNVLLEMLGLEKGDFKGLSAAGKVVMLFRELGQHVFKYPETTIDEALTKTNGARRENHGAI